MRTPSKMLFSAVALAAAGSMLSVAVASEDDSYIAVVTGDNVYVRSGAADSYYPFGRVNAGDLVKVTGEKFNWGRVATVGPTFTSDRFYGYIIYPTTQPGRFRLSEDGKSGITLGRADVLAPNLNTGNNPNDSWKPLIRLEAGSDVIVLETSTTANNTVHKIVLPEKSEAWISMAYLRKANDAQVREWEAKMRPAPDPSETTPEPTAQPKPAATTPPGGESTTPSTPQPRVERQPSTPPTTTPTEPEVVPATTEQPAQPQVQPVQPPQEQVRPRQEIQPEPAPATRPAVTDRPEPLQSPQPQPVQTRPVPEQRDVQSPADETVMPTLGNVNPEPPVTEPAEPPLAERLANATLDDLEQAYEQLRKDDVEQAEFGPLREMYLSFAARVEADDRTGAAFARSRVEQLELLSEVQQRRNELNQLRARARISAERAEAARLAVDAGGDYIAVGRLASSTIYDGRRLPKMLRLQDPGTGRTVAYIEPDEGYDMAGMLDQLIGVIGEKTYDGGLRLNVLKPRRIDILAPR